MDGKGVHPGPSHRLLGPRALSLPRCAVPCGKLALGSPLLFMLGGSPFLAFTDSNSSLAGLLSLATVHGHTAKEPTVTEGCATPNPAHSLDGGNESTRFSRCFGNSTPFSLPAAVDLSTTTNSKPQKQHHLGSDGDSGRTSSWL